MPKEIKKSKTVCGIEFKRETADDEWTAEITVDGDEGTLTLLAETTAEGGELRFVNYYDGADNTDGPACATWTESLHRLFEKLNIPLNGAKTCGNCDWANSNGSNICIALPGEPRETAPTRFGCVFWKLRTYEAKKQAPAEPVTADKV